MSLTLSPVTPSEYHSRKFNPKLLPDINAAGPISASVLSSSRNPLVFLTKDTQRTTKFMDWGNLVDCLWLTPNDLVNQFVVLPDDAPRDNRHLRNAKAPKQETLDSIAWWDNFDQKCIGKTLITPEKLAEAKNAVEMLKNHDLASDIYDQSLKQVAIRGFSEQLGLNVKSMMDLYPKLNSTFCRCTVDFKTRADVSERGMSNAIFEFEYGMKMAFYKDMAEEVDGCERPDTLLIFQRSSYPYDIHVRKIANHDIEIGRQLYLKRIEKILRMDHRNLDVYRDLELKEIGCQDWQRDLQMREIHGEVNLEPDPILDEEAGPTDE